MKVLYITYHGLSEYSGISKKILAQVKGLQQIGHEVFLCTYTIDGKGQRKRMVNNICIENYGVGFWAKIKKRFCYNSIVRFAIGESIDFVYIRSFNNANPMTIWLVKKLKRAGMKVVMEIPTYPYDQEFNQTSWRVQFNLYIDKLFRNHLAECMDRIITFSDASFIFGQKTIKISNGIDFDSISIQQKKNKKTNEIHLLGVAEVHYWHGYDRLITGLGEYYKEKRDVKFYFHIVGGVADSEMYGTNSIKGFKPIIDKYNIEEFVKFHGTLYGGDLDDIFNQTDFAIGSLGRHRTGIDKIKTLKNREYAARGIPFIYSESDADFDQKPYVLRIPADDTPIDISKLLEFFFSRSWHPEDIRNSIKNLSWAEQMKSVIRETFKL